MCLCSCALFSYTKFIKQYLFIPLPVQSTNIANPSFIISNTTDDNPVHPQAHSEKLENTILTIFYQLWTQWCILKEGAVHAYADQLTREPCLLTPT